MMRSVGYILKAFLHFTNIIHFPHNFNRIMTKFHEPFLKYLFIGIFIPGLF